MPTYLVHTELDDETSGRALSSPLFIQEREEPADRRRAYHFFEASLLPAQSLSVCHARTGETRSRSREKPSRDSEDERMRILFERQKEQIIDDFRAAIFIHDFQADSDRGCIQELNGIIESQS